MVWGLSPSWPQALHSPLPYQAWYRVPQDTQKPQLAQWPCVSRRARLTRAGTTASPFWKLTVPSSSLPSWGPPAVSQSPALLPERLEPRKECQARGPWAGSAPPASSLPVFRQPTRVLRMHPAPYFTWPAAVGTGTTQTVQWRQALLGGPSPKHPLGCTCSLSLVISAALSAQLHSWCWVLGTGMPLLYAPWGADTNIQAGHTS